jgi:hypothetical protein
MMYHHIASRLTDDGRVHLDALLGDPAAQAELDKGRRDTVSTAGFEVG